VSFIDCCGLRIILQANAEGPLELLTGPVVERLLLVAGVRDGLNIQAEPVAALEGRPRERGAGEAALLAALGRPDTTVTGRGSRRDLDEDLAVEDRQRGYLIRGVEQARGVKANGSGLLSSPGGTASTASRRN